MTTPAAPFTVESVEWIESVSAELRTDRMRPPPQRTGVRSVALLCNACGAAWRARSGPNRGQFQPLLGGAIYVKCPECQTEASIANNALP